MSSTEVAGALARRWLKERRRSAARFEYLLSQPATGAGDGGGALLERLAYIDALRTSVAACCALTCEARAAAAAAAAAATAAAAAAAAASAVGTGGAAVAGGGGPRLLSRLAIAFEEELQLMEAIAAQLRSDMPSVALRACWYAWECNPADDGTVAAAAAAAAAAGDGDA